MSTKISDLSPKAQVLYTALMAKLEAQGIKMVCTYTFRTASEQQALFAQGREALISVNAKRKAAGLPPINEASNKDTVTNCDGVKKLSNHQSGNAFDMAFVGANGNPTWPPTTTPEGAQKWLQFGVLAESVGLVWGGRWAPFNGQGIGFDAPHVEVPK